MEHLQANVSSLLRPPLPYKDLIRLQTMFKQVDNFLGHWWGWSNRKTRTVAQWYDMNARLMTAIAGGFPLPSVYLRGLWGGQRSVKLISFGGQYFTSIAHDYRVFCDHKARISTTRSMVSKNVLARHLNRCGVPLLPSWAWHSCRIIFHRKRGASSGKCLLPLASSVAL